MNFSELFRQSSQICKFSPDGKFLASVVEFRLVIRDVATFQIQNLFSCLDTVQQIEWSPDSQFIFCGLYKRGIVQIWSLEQPEWKCKVDEGSAGLCDVSVELGLHQIGLSSEKQMADGDFQVNDIVWAKWNKDYYIVYVAKVIERHDDVTCPFLRWSPDSRHILTTADFHLRITVWSIATKSVSYIRYPKQCQKNIDFTSDGRYMALAERRECQDFISIFACSSWELIKHFEARTEDLSGLQWSPDGAVLCVWDNPLNYLVLIYSIDGRCLSKFSAYEFALGIKTLAWSSTGQFLAIGSYDEKLRLLNHVTWKTVTNFEHPETVDNNNVVVYREIETRTPKPVKSDITDIPTTALFSPLSKYEVQTSPVSIPIVKPDLNKANPKRGIGLAGFSHDCRYLYTRNDNMPQTLWIWGIRQLAICGVVIQSSAIKCVEWDPVKTRLALCTGLNKLYMWSPAGSLCVEVPVEGTFQVHSLKWHPNGGSLLLLGKDMMCMCYLNDNQADA